MNRHRTWTRHFAAALLSIQGAVSGQSVTNAYSVQFAGFTNVVVDAGFWKQRLDTNRFATIPHLIQLCERSGYLDNFAVAGGRRTNSVVASIAGDAVVYQTVEAASYCYARSRDPALGQWLEKTVELIVSAQEENGYLYTPRTIALARLNDTNAPPRWSNSTELELSAHLYEAAVAHFHATGKTSLLTAAIKNAELVERIFGPGKRSDLRPSPGIEQGLVTLSRVTGDERWLKLARSFVETRGTTNGGGKLPGEISQGHRALIEQDKAIGHVRGATSLYSSLTDLVMFTGETNFRRGVERSWDELVSTRLYITGGIGSRTNGSFGEPFDLPNFQGSTDASADISFSKWNTRMFQLTGDAKYLDVLERTLFNHLLAGVSIDGTRFFHSAPQASDGKLKFNGCSVFSNDLSQASAERRPGFACACSPANIASYLEQIPSLTYATSSNAVFVNFFLNNTALLQTTGATVQLRQVTDYPWSGRVRLTVESVRPIITTGEIFSIYVRLPGWARETPVPTDLYRFTEKSEERPLFYLNGEQVTPALENGFVRITRAWIAGDILTIDLPTPIRHIRSHTNVVENAGRISLQRGPLVYAIEGLDHGGKLQEIVAPSVEDLGTRRDPRLGIVIVGPNDPSSRQKPTSFRRAIPYFTWNNRGATEMTTWIKTE